MGACTSHNVAEPPEKANTNIKQRKTSGNSTLNDNRKPPRRRKVDITKGSVWNTYTKKKVLGEGGSCQVYLGRRKPGAKKHPNRETNAKEDFAIKIISKKVYGQRALWLEELSILQDVRHPYIIYLVEAFEDSEECAMVLEMMRGPELFEAAANPDFHFSEMLAAQHFKTMCGAVAHLHSRQVVHGDLKPENFVFTERSFDSKVKLIDFGCAITTRPKTEHTVIGVTHYYASPELLQNMRYGLTRFQLKAADMWALGVILYILLTGQRPFNGHDAEAVRKSIFHHEVRFPRSSHLSRRVKNLIRGLLEKDPEQRLSAAQALEHEWVTDELNNPDIPLDVVLLDSLSNLRRVGQLKRAVARMLADNLTPREKQQMNKLFNSADKDRSGTLDLQEVEVFMQTMALKSPTTANRGLGISERRLSNLAMDVIANVDDDNDQMVDPQEFRRMLQLALLASDDQLIRKAFNLLDSDHSGTVSGEELHDAFGKYFPAGEGAAFAQMMMEADSDGDGEISWEEFKVCMSQELGEPLQQRRMSESKNGAPSLSRRASRSADVLENLAM